MHKTREAIDEQQEAEFILEGNKIIAEFMGWEVDEYTGREIDYLVEGQLDVYPKVVNNWIAFQHMRFHSSWNWLKPVCEKIAQINEETTETNIIRMPNWEFGSLGLESPIDAVYKATVKFIERWNNIAVNS